MILVTGATGNIGSQVVRLLAASGARVRAMTRDPARLKAHGPTVEAARADFDDRASLDAAMAGVDAMFLACAPGASVATHDLAAIAAATAAGVRKVVKLSSLGADTTTLRASGWHRPGEAALRDGPLAWTILRPAGFASNTLAWAATIRASGTVHVSTGSGRQGIVDPRDLAAAAVAALTTDEHVGRAYTITGPELLSAGEQVAALAAVLGRQLDVVDVPVAAVRERLVAAGVADEFVAAVVEGTEYLRAGHAATLDGALATVLGRPPRRFAEWAAEHRAAFA